MPDFDRNLNPLMKDARLPVEEVLVKAPTPVAPRTFGSGPAIGEPGDGDLLTSISRKSNFGDKGVFVTNATLDANRRYSTFNPTISNYEDFAAYGQSNWDKAANGILKGLNLTATTVAGLGGLLYGATKATISGKFSDLYNNEAMQKLDEWNTKVDNEYLPNYYTDKEKNAKWYSTDNWLKTNFLFDQLIKNSGFAVGAVISGNIVSGGIGVLGSAVGRGAMTLARAAESAQAFKAFTPILTNTARAFSVGKNIEAAAILEKEISTIADITEHASQMANISKATNAFAKFNDVGRRSVIGLFSSAGEASFEAIQTGKEFKENLIQQYKDSHYGAEPDEAAMAEIDAQTTKVGNTSFVGNMALLGITEYVQLPKLMGSSYAANKQVANSLLGKVDNVVLKGGEYVAAEKAVTKFGKLYDRAAGVGRYIFDPKEGAQEVLQYALQVGTENYFNKAYRTNDADAWVDGVMFGFLGKNERGEDVGALTSKEGIIGGILGGFTGGLMQAKANFKESRATTVNTQQYLADLNNAPTFKKAFQERLEAGNRGVVLQQQEQDAIIQGDQLEARDLEADQMHNYLAPRIKYGRFDMVMDDIDSFRQQGSSEAGLAALKQEGFANINDTVASFQKRLNNFERVAKNTEQIFKSTNLRFGGQILTDEEGNPILDADGQQQRKYSPRVIDKMVYAASKVADYDVRIPLVSSVPLSKGIDVQSIIDSELSDDASAALGNALNEIDKTANPIEKDEIKQNLKDSVELALRRRQFLNEYNDLKNNPQNYDASGEKNMFNEEGKKLKTTPAKEGDSKYSAESRLPFKGDKRTYDDLVKQYGEGEQNKYDVLRKITESPYATTMEKELAAHFMKYTDRKSKIILGDRMLPNPGLSVTDLSSPTASISRINYEYSADDYEGKTMPVEYILLHEIGHDLTVYALKDANDPFYKDLEPIFNFVQEHFKNDENKYAKNGLLRGGEFYAFKNIKEFATEALSNRDFQRYLNTIPYKNTTKSVWENFVDNLKTFFRRLFGINSDTALDEVVGIVTNNIDRVYRSQREQNKKLTEEEEKAKAEAIEIKKNAEKIEKQLTQIELNSGDNGTPEGEVEVSTIPEGKLKGAAKFFASGTSQIEKDDVSKDPTHVRNSREFFNNAKNFKNRENLRAFLVTPNQEKALGLEGLTALSYNGEDMSQSTDVDNGFVAQVFIEQEGGKNYFIDKNGERLGEVGQPVDITQVIFQTMPTTSIYYEATDKQGRPIPRYRTGEKEEFEAYSKSWRAKREQLFKDPGTAIKTYKFNISRGIEIENPLVNGNRERNHVGDLVIPENKISKQQGLVMVPIDGNVYHQGENINFPKGTPVIQYGDTLYFLKNALLGKEKAQNVYQVIKAMSEEFLKTKDINPKYAEFLQNVLYLRTKGATTKAGSNQIFIDPKTAEIFLGGKRYAINDVANKENEIVEQLTKTYHNTNNFTLSKRFNAPFYEFIYKDGKLEEVEWKNYQTYLLAAKNPDGSARNTANTPLTTTLSKPTTLRPYSFKQKYATLLDFELPIQPVVKPAPVAQAAPAVTGMLGEFKMDGETKNTFTEFNAGPIDFTGTLDENGNISVDVLQNDTITKVAKNQQLVNETIIPALKAADAFDPSADDVELVSTFVANKLVAELKKLQAPAAPAVQPTVPEEVYEAFTEEREKSKEQDIEEEQRQIEGKPAEPGKYNPDNTSAPDDEYQRVGLTEVGKERLTDAEIAAFKEWHAQNVPGIPFEVLDNIVTTHDNEKAFGVFQEGVAKFYKGALKATPYHEIGEGVWKAFLTPEQRQAIIDEQRATGENFVDRATGKTLNYATATDQQIKERIMDDFGDFKAGKIAARSLGEMVRNFFRSIVEFFKSFVSKPSLKDELFKAIDSGKFKEFKVSDVVRADSMAEYSRIPGLTETQKFEYVDDMLSRASFYIFGQNKRSLFDISKITSNELFDYIKGLYEKEGKYQELGEERWQMLVDKTKQKLRTFGINFNEEERIDINDDSVSNKEYVSDPFTTDWKKSSPFAIKITLATLPQVEPTNQENKDSMSLPKRILSSIKGYRLADFGSGFATVLNKLSNTSKVSKAVSKLADLAKYDATYVRFFQRVGGDIETGTVNFSEFKDEDWRLFVNMMQVFTKQKPDALIQYMDGNSVYTAPANQFTAAKQIENNWFDNMKALARVPKSIIKFNRETKTYNVNLDSPLFPKTRPKDATQMVEFLKNLGVGIDMNLYNSMKTKQRKDFSEAVSEMYTYIQNTKEIGTIGGKTLGISSQLARLSNMVVTLTNPNQENTYFGVEGKRVQTYADNNAPSVFENEFNDADTLEELVKERPELNDVFSKNSVVLKQGGEFFDEEGNRVKSLKVSYIQGTKNLTNDKGTTTSKLTLGNRFTQELNQNLNGNYYILVPADSSTEWMINLGNHISFSDVATGRAVNKINKIFKGYLIDDIALALDGRNQKNVGNKSKELRFFKDFLSEKDANGNERSEVLLGINEMIKEGQSLDDIKEFVEKKENEEMINNAIQKFINDTVTESKKILSENGETFINVEDKLSYPALNSDFASNKDVNINKNDMSEKDLNNILFFANANYIMNNIEMHKVLFGDPYQFEVKKDGSLDETKRIKSFLSPRRTTFDSPEFNTFLNNAYNMAGDIEVVEGELGYHNHDSFTNTVTLADTMAETELYPEAFKVADAASWLKDNTYREIKLKNGQWTTEAEKWHQWQMAYTRQNMPGYEYKSEALKKQDEKLVNTPEPEFVTEVLKPIVSGVKAGATNIDLVLDKFSQMPLYFKAVQGTNLEKLYTKMWKENVGYAIMQSGRKVGAVKLHNLYNEDGTFNEQPFAKDTMVEVPWKSYGIQVENSFENPKEQTRGSQLTKLSSLDFFNDGEASDEARKEYQRNKSILDKMHENAYNQLLNRLGIEDLGTSFKMTDPAAISKTLEGEMLRRTLSENGIDTIQLDQNGQFPIPFEASPVYQQIRSILYSMVNKSLISPKVNGAPHVQVPVTGWEKAGSKSSTGTLAFYSKGKTQTNPCEVMLPHWFKEKLSKKRFPNDEALLKYLNSTPEGRSILTGIGFRIPTQAMSSTEVFKVKGFLPKSMGYTVVVPAEITAKTGSDFDIDKLNMYLKATYIDKNGDIRLVRLMDDEAKTKEFFANVFDEKLEKKKITKAELLEATQILAYGLEDPNNLVERYSDILDSVLEGAEDSSEYEQKVMDELKKLGDKNIQGALKEKFVNNMYKKALENEYYDSLEKMILLPENFERLVSPIGDGGLKAVAKKLDKLRGEDESKIPNRLLNRNYMTSLRNAFVMAKKWVGIGAVNITGQSNTQKSKIYVDPERFELVSEFDQKILGDGSIILPHNTVKIGDEEYVSISGNKTADGKEYISDRLSGYITSFVDVAKDPYIMKIIRSNSVVGTFMFLERIGAGEKTIEFLNQPIITEYLKYLDSIGKTGLFGKMDGEYIKNLFPTTGAALKSTNINLDNLLKNIEDFANQSLTAEQNAEQQKIFDEFLKYAKMAQYSFKLTQATNYDTTKFTSGDTLFRKQYRTKDARETNIFSSVDKILDGSFIGEQAKLIDKSMEGMGAILKLEQDKFRSISDQVLEKYARQEYMSDDDYEKMGNKIKASFLDYIIQIKSGVNNDIKTLLVDSSSSIDVQLAEAKKKHPEMKLLKDLTVESSKRMNGAKTIKLMANNRGDAMDENMYIGMMRELKAVDNELYNNIVTTAILQGTYQSSVSIRNIIPVEDFSARIAPIINKLADTEDVKAFSKGAFQRNNWKDESVMPTLERLTFKPTETVVGEQLDKWGDHVADIYQYISPMFPDKVLNTRSVERKILKIHPDYFRISIDNDFIKVPRVITSTKDNQKVDMITGQTITDESYKARKAMNDLSLYDYFGYQKVRDELGEPLVTNNGEFIYKLINLYGDGQYASEYHLDGQPSPIDNGTIKIDNEIPNKDLIQFFAPKIEEKVLPSQPKTEPTIDTSKKINIYAGTGENAELSNFARRPFKLGDGVTYPTVEHAFQLEKLQYSNAYTDDQKLAIIKDMNTKSPAQVKAFGKTIKGLNVKMWNEDASMIMKDLINQSFQANPEALQKLLATENAELTHTQDTTRWGKEFPKLLMEVREELKSTQAPVNEFNESRFNNIENEIGEIITVDNSDLRLLSVEETDYDNVKFLRLQSKSGLIVPATIEYNEETGESEIIPNPTADDLGLDEEDYNTDDFKC